MLHQIRTCPNDSHQLEAQLHEESQFYNARPASQVYLKDTRLSDPESLVATMDIKSGLI